MSVSEVQLNEMVATTIRDDSRITNLQLVCEENVIVVNASIQVVGSLAITAKTKLAIEHFELSQERKVITLRRLDTTELGGTGVAALAIGSCCQTCRVWLVWNRPWRIISQKH